MSHVTKPVWNSYVTFIRSVVPCVASVKKAYIHFFSSIIYQEVRIIKYKLRMSINVAYDLWVFSTVCF